MYRTIHTDISFTLIFSLEFDIVNPLFLVDGSFYDSTSRSFSWEDTAKKDINCMQWWSLLFPLFPHLLFSISTPPFLVSISPAVSYIKKWNASLILYEWEETDRKRTNVTLVRKKWVFILNVVVTFCYEDGVCRKMRKNTEKYRDSGKLFFPLSPQTDREAIWWEEQFLIHLWAAPFCLLFAPALVYICVMARKGCKIICWCFAILIIR